MINIILLSSEIPKGMKSYGPRSLIPIGKSEEPLIIKQIKKIQSIYKSSRYKIHIVVGFESDKIVKLIKEYNLIKNINFIYDDCYESCNNTYGLLKALKEIKGDNCLIVQSGVVGCYKPIDLKKSSLGIFRSSANIFNIGIRSENDKAVYLFYDLENSWSEIAFIGSNDYANIITLLSSDTFSKKIKSSFLFETINLLIEHNINFYLEPINFNRNISKYLHYKNNQSTIC
jgi:hypothetical protein